MRARTSRPKTIDARYLERVALRYLDRFDSSVANLRKVLMRTVRRAAREQTLDVSELTTLVEALCARYVASSLLDDDRYARAFVASQRGRGASRRMILQKLRMRGVAGPVAEAALGDDDARSGSADTELEAALALVRKRRLGPHRAPEQRDARQRRDLATLARAGFSFDVARRALKVDLADDDF
jgi:regulatory protein